MRRTFVLYLALCLGIGALYAEGVGTSRVVECGTWIELKATPAADYHFVSWSDGNTESLRQIQVNEDANYIAYFAANCEEYANWPVEALYDWLLMLNVNKIGDMGYYVSPQNVHWYRVVGEPDDLHDAFPQDDQKVADGCYLTIAQNLQGTGDYYAIVDVSANSAAQLCDGLMRTVIVHYSSDQVPERSVALLPNAARKGGMVHLTGINPDEETEVEVYDAAGHLIYTDKVSGREQIDMPTDYAAGYYCVWVKSKRGIEVLKYIIQN